MVLELIIFGLALTLVSVGNHLYLSDARDPPASKRIAAHTEYLLGTVLLFFATPLTATMPNIGVFAVAALGLYAVVTKTTEQSNIRPRSVVKKLR